MNGVMVSVVCTNYNKGDWLHEAIDSFLAQKTSFDFEILLIDDKSTDHSVDIIKKYAAKYPGRIRALYNSENLGITKTWKKVCKEVKGKYVARCDGDDYWIDDQKLQKQVDLLESSKDARWCSTDYDVIDPFGKILQTGAIESGAYTRPTSYEEMLATKGMTMASTWLVDTKLMLEVNEELDPEAVDDTFNIQLDLFQKTRLTYLPDATAVYRLNEGSDSKPLAIEAAQKRDERLLETQIQYLRKYKDVDYEDVIERLLRRSSVADDRLRLIQRQRSLIEEQERMIADNTATIAERDKTIQLQQQQIHEILDSKRYRVGRIVTAPVVIIKRALKGKKRT